MRWNLSHAFLATAMLVPFLIAGCDPFKAWRRQDEKVELNPAVKGKADVPSLVKYLNENAERVQNLTAKVDVDLTQDNQSFSVGGQLACRKPRDFRMKLRGPGGPVADLGSNEERFWLWAAQNKEPGVITCSYTDLMSGKISMPLPFNPDMIVAALGIAEYPTDPKLYSFRENARTLELMQEITAPDGRKAVRITVFDKNRVNPPYPQVLAHVLRDPKGNLLCQATIKTVAKDANTNAMLPTSVKIEYPAEKLTMKLTVFNVATNKINSEESPTLFTMDDLASLPKIDIGKARTTPAGRSGFRGTSK